jgi:single-strand DNA-binding protein
MGNSVNRVFLLGRSGKDAEVRKTSSGKDVMTFTLATNEYYKDAQGNKQENTVWHNIVKFGNPSIANYIKKGGKLYIEGKINNRSYENDAGKKIYISEIIASNIQLLDSNPEYKQEASKPVSTADSFDNDFDEVPF